MLRNRRTKYERKEEKSQRKNCHEMATLSKLLGKENEPHGNDITGQDISFHAVCFVNSYSITSMKIRQCCLGCFVKRVVLKYNNVKLCNEYL